MNLKTESPKTTIHNKKKKPPSDSDQTFLFFTHIPSPWLCLFLVFEARSSPELAVRFSRWQISSFISFCWMLRKWGRLATKKNSHKKIGNWVFKSKAFSINEWNIKTRISILKAQWRFVGFMFRLNFSASRVLLSLDNGGLFAFSFSLLWEANLLSRLWTKRVVENREISMLGMKFLL